MSKKLDIKVEELVERIRKEPSSRFSKSDYQLLVYAVLSDDAFRAKKYLLHNGNMLEEDVCIADAMKKFMDKVLKHAGMTDASERAAVIDTFDYSPKDVEWVADAVDEAMHLYTEAGKNMRVFRNSMLQLAFKKMQRSGKYAGKITYKKTITDRTSKLQ